MTARFDLEPPFLDRILWGELTKGPSCTDCAHTLKGLQDFWEGFVSQPTIKGEIELIMKGEAYIRGRFSPL